VRTEARDETDTAEGQGGVSALLDMQVFFPYRFAVLADAVSRSVAQLYADRFSLTRHEWRVLAALAALTTATATEVADYSTLDKMQASRAIAELEAKGCIVRAEGRADRRTKTLKLTAAGRALFRRIVPLVKEREAALLAALTPEERATLSGIMDKLLARARGLTGG